MCVVGPRHILRVMRFPYHRWSAALCAVLALGPGRLALAQASGACRGEPTRSTAIGGVVGAAFLLGMALRSDRDHHISADERLPYVWGATWGAVLGSGVGYYVAHARCPELRVRPQPLPTDIRDCSHATWSGMAKGAAGGGLAAFLAAPFLLLGPGAVAVLSGHRFDFNRAVLVTTAAGAVIAAPIGARREREACMRTLDGVDTSRPR